MLTYAGWFVGRRRELDVGAAVCRRRAQRRLPSRCSVYYSLYWYKSTHTDAERAVGDAEAACVVIALGGVLRRTRCNGRAETMGGRGASVTEGGGGVVRSWVCERADTSAGAFVTGIYIYRCVDIYMSMS
jgi:hypothetical protein